MELQKKMFKNTKQKYYQNRISYFGNSTKACWDIVNKVTKGKKTFPILY